MSRFKRVFVICMAVMLGTICAAGCASDEKKEDSKLPGYVVYTANSSGTGLDSERYEIRETEANDVINRLYKLVIIPSLLFDKLVVGSTFNYASLLQNHYTVTVTDS